MKLHELGEFGLINRIQQRIGPGRGVVRGIGDDAAQLELEPGLQLLTTTDLLIEGSHFNFAWTTAADLGHKAVAVNLSDIAAMGGEPRYLYLALACPGSTEVDSIEAFLDGAIALSERHRVTLVGGDTCRSPGPWVVSITVEGVIPAGRAIGRDTAQGGDVIVVSGCLGDSALALHLLQQGEAVAEALAVRHHRPRPQIELGQLLADSGCVTAMIDVSDGIVADLGHILQASRVGGVLDVPKIPLSTAFACALRKQPGLIDLALAGGEDYELLLTVPAQKLQHVLALGQRLGIPLTAVGSLRGGEPVLFLRDAGGQERPCARGGYDHFASSGEEGMT